MFCLVVRGRSESEVNFDRRRSARVSPLDLDAHHDSQINIVSILSIHASPEVVSGEVFARN